MSWTDRCENRDPVKGCGEPDRRDRKGESGRPDSNRRLPAPKAGALGQAALHPVSGKLSRSSERRQHRPEAGSLLHQSEGVQDAVGSR